MSAREWGKAGGEESLAGLFLLQRNMLRAEAEVEVTWLQTPPQDTLQWGLAEVCSGENLGQTLTSFRLFPLSPHRLPNTTSGILLSITPDL